MIFSPQRLKEHQGSQSFTRPAFVEVIAWTKTGSEFHAKECLATKERKEHKMTSESRTIGPLLSLCSLVAKFRRIYRDIRVFVFHPFSFLKLNHVILKLQTGVAYEC